MRTRDKEATWCAGETAWRQARARPHAEDTTWARLGGWRQDAGRGQGPRPERFRLQEGVCIFIDENPLKELKQKNQAALFGSRGGVAWEGRQRRWGPTSIHDSRSEWTEGPGLRLSAPALSSMPRRKCGFPGGAAVRNLPVRESRRASTPGWEDPLEDTATHCSIRCLGEPHGQSCLGG